MKVSTITLATALALSSAGAMAQSGGNSLDEMAASSAPRSAMNSLHRKHHHYHVQGAQPAAYYHVQGVQPAASNGHGINSLGVTTNSGRKYNGG